jgi:hypothetical protein
MVIAVALIVLAVTAEVPVMLAVSAVAGVAQSLVLLTYITLRTVYSPDELLGRIGSTARVLSLGLQPIGLLVGGALIALWPDAREERRLAERYAGATVRA